MKILVTGGTGYVGSHCIRPVIDKGHQVVVFDNLERGNKDLVPENIKIIIGDLKDYQAIDSVLSQGKFDAVMHFAAYAYVGESMEEPEKYFTNNVIGGMNLLRAMREHGVGKIIFSSSNVVYGQPEKMPIDEKFRFDPINPYGETKVIFERLLKWYDRVYGIKHFSLRYFNAAGAAYGIGEVHQPETHLIPLVILVALGQVESISVLGTDYPTPDGTCVRDYTHIEDLADAHILALEYLEKNNKSNFVNLGTGKGYSVKEIINKVKQVSGKDFKVIEKDRRLGDPAILVAANEKAKKVLNWQPKHGLDSMIKSAWDWHSKNIKK